MSKNLCGVFATRSPVRPNPIAISELKVLAIQGNRLEVFGLDILDGTPIVDIKKKIHLSNRMNEYCSKSGKIWWERMYSDVILEAYLTSG